MKLSFKWSFLNRLKQISIVSFAAIVVLITSMTTSKADMNSDITQILYYVKEINTTTTAMLQAVNKLPDAVNNVAVYLLNMVQSDTSTEISALQNSMGTLSQIILKNTDIDGDLQNKLLGTLFGNKKLSNQGDLLYTNILIPNSPNTVNYISNVGGLNIPHYSPDAFEYKSDVSKQNYTTFYNTVMAIGSFNAYVLSSMKNENDLTDVQKKLLQQAGDSTWFSKVANDPIGNVLRRILMFQSQQFLFFNELIKTQKQLLYAQVMTNTLLMNYGRTDEKTLIRESIK